MTAIAYLAKHQSGGNDDEGSIAFALEQLGHRVERLREYKAIHAHKMPGDFMLVHHCSDFHSLRRVTIPKVFWCFDLIDAKDRLVGVRSHSRTTWVREATEVCDLGFLTDGDWVDQDKTGKLHWLPQGADERRLDMQVTSEPGAELLFLGIAKNGTKRLSFVQVMRERYGDRFQHVERGVYGESFVQVVRNAAINVAPDGPVSDRYFSNRCVNVLGAGGFLLHPYSRAIADMYPEGVVFYRSREELHQLIAEYLERPEERRRIAAAGLEQTKAKHLYRHRCVELLRVVKERLL